MVYDTVCETNIDGFEEALKEHSQEEADTLMVLYALEIAERDPFPKYVLYLQILTCSFSLSVCTPVYAKILFSKLEVEII